ncbi:hypothetical protein ID866_5149 [Astraeus odoratus]|nr:hypothetical protein ID866_5149 [Astraeus odoratus]
MTSRTPSPSPACAPSSSTCCDAKAASPQKFRLLPTTLENADAIVLVLPPTTPHAPQPEPLLLMGPALQRFRQPHRRLTRGTRVHPYRIDRGAVDSKPSRRPPMLPTNTNV